jgi:hypothetical protein
VHRLKVSTEADERSRGNANSKAKKTLMQIK